MSTPTTTKRRPTTRRTAVRETELEVEPELEDMLKLEAAEADASEPADEGDDADMLSPDGDNDDGEETPIKARRRVRILRSQAINMRTRVAKMRARMGGWSEPMDSALEQLASAADAFQIACNALPDEFSPPRKAGGRGPSKELAVGDVLRVLDRVRSKYEGIIDEADFDALTVVKQIGNRVVVRNGAGEKLILPRGHVALRHATSTAE